MPLKRYLARREHSSFYSQASNTSYYKSFCCVQKDTSSLEQDIPEDIVCDDYRPTLQEALNSACSNNTNPLLDSWLAALEPHDPFQDDVDNTENILEIINATISGNTPATENNSSENHKRSMAKKICKLMKNLKKLRPVNRLKNGPRSSKIMKQES